VLAKHFIAAKISTVVEFGELEDDLHHFGLVCTAEAVVAGSSEDALDAFKHHLWANRVGGMVERSVEVLVLFGNHQYGFVCLHQTAFVCSSYGLLDVWPHVRCVVPIQVNDLL